jgi:hypothetical protein
MSTLKVNAVRGTAASSDAITVHSTDGTCTAKITNRRSHNLIVNGSCNVAQRGTSSTSDGIVAVDRFTTSIAGNDESPTTSQAGVTSNDPGPWEKGFRNALRITNGNQTGGAGADDRIVIQYKIEAQDIARSGWDYTSSSSYITLSFWCKSHSVAQNFYGHFTSEDGTSQSYIFETGSLTAGTWKHVTVKIPGNSNITVDDNTGQGFYIEWVLFRGTNKTASGKALNTWAAFDSSARVPDMTSTYYTTNDAQFELTGVQLEVSDHATDFEHLSYEDDLRRCQRYYQVLIEGDSGGSEKTFGSSTVYSATSLHLAVRLSPEMRTTPTADFSTGTNYFKVFANNASDSFDAFTLAGNSTNRVADIYADSGVSSTAGSSGLLRTANGSAKIAFSAEL